MRADRLTVGNTRLLTGILILVRRGRLGLRTLSTMWRGTTLLSIGCGLRKLFPEFWNRSEDDCWRFSFCKRFRQRGSMYDMALRTFLTLFICTSFDGPRKSSIVPSFTDSFAEFAWGLKCCCGIALLSSEFQALLTSSIRSSPQNLAIVLARLRRATNYQALQEFNSF